MSNDNTESKTEKTLYEELDELYQDVQSRLDKASFLGKNMAQKLAPIEKIIGFIGKVVLKIEALDKENIFLKEELVKVNEELAKQSTILKNSKSSEEVRREMGIAP